MRRSAEFIPPHHATPRLYRTGFCHIGHIHHQTRRHLKRVKPGIRLLHHFTGNTQGHVADINGIARFQIKQRHQTRRQQYATRLRFHSAWTGLQFAVHRINAIHCLHAGQLRRIAGKRHGRKG
ncbi:Uncharacterised protein [Salmonella enterica subsp. enterica serovar Bovismorbificans]|uniref:Uncharacterized protein n=1 Tax=Salmonella enterica subsp. enterica serovar Bovismorbificans TaxID=58097 RepID=A0A655BLK6_SALET|nr:Uncharacterised protein [Salmonella enterica subsp. enterica serovar Bovismorbificans]